MPATKQIVSLDKTARPKKITKKTATQKYNFLTEILFKVKNNRFIVKSQLKMQDFLVRRPHRSFQRTYRRDYVRPLDMPGYWAFTNHVRKILWDNRKLFLYVIIIYAVLTVTLISFASEDTYMQLRDSLNSTASNAFTGVWGELSKAGLILAAGATGALNSAQIGSQGQSQIFPILIGLLTWLTTVWLLRAILAGRRPKMRDGLYNAGAPILPTFLVSAVIIVQLIPMALAFFAYNAAVVSGLLDGGAEAMMFWLVAGLLVVLSLYWITSTLIALVVVTLPGMYPMQALRTAGDLVVGRRVRILLRLLWLVFTVVLTWAIVVIPIILFDGWIKSAWDAIWWLPLVPIVLLLMGAFTVIWVAGYVYLLYRKIVEDDALPA
ncbi:MAG: hypothetical protein JWO55_804 [Candidatus Saccharibacteria bacterium]|jgi:hypothetical protein|nr:hypothetical protein [Candidatus Saccharibacteria bacterium]